MGKFLLFVIVIGSAVLYLTNPTTAEVQAQLSGQLPGGTPTVPAAPLGPADVQQPPDVPPADPNGPPPQMPDIPAPTVAQGDMQLDRQDFYLFSVYKVTVGGQQLPGCVVGIAKQAIPMTSCPGV